MSRQLVWVRGGTDPEAVGALYAELTARLERPEPDWPVLVLAASREQFDDCVGRIAGPLDRVDVVIRTSGSTDGRGRLVGLSLDALLASARATLVRLGGPGRWLTSLPIEAVGGFQVVLRSVVAGLPPAVYTGHGFDPDRFARAAAMLDGAPRRYLSLVPTQLHRALGSAPAVLASFDAVLVGGAALAPQLAARALACGVPVVTTYGSTETAGGCVYDGVPLDGVRVRLSDDGRIHIGGPTRATRYLDAAPTECVEAGTPGSSEIGEWLVTNDLGEWVDGRLRVLGRSDDVVISGGVNVHPVAVEAALATLGGQWLVVGVPDAEWGQLLVAVTDLPGATLDDAKRATAGLVPAARPKAVVVVDALPLRPSGKPDRRAAVAFLLANFQFWWTETLARGSGSGER